jgi:glycosyltransferase involved in cell wall biosynthesis
MKVLLSAYQCQPEFNPEASVGWYWAITLSQDHDVVVITRPWAPSPESPSANSAPRLRFEFYALPRWCEIFNKPDHRHHIYYALWQIGAFLRARGLLRTERFDVVHHVVYHCTWQPTFMPFLGVPFIFGPIGEHDRMPLAVARHYGWGTVVREYFGRFMKTALRRYSPVSWYAYRRASHVLVANDDIFSALPPWLRAKTTVQPGFAGFSGPVPPPARNSRFQLLFVGRFVHLKAPDLALRAFLQFARGKTDVTFTMVGRGPMCAELHRLRDRDPAGRSVNIVAWTTRAAVRRMMEACDAFLFPTFEGGATVVIEAMSIGKPVVAVAFGAPATYLRPNSGICVPCTTPDEIVTRLADALETLYRDESLRLQIGRRARSVYEERYSWPAKLALINKVYSDACAPEKPHPIRIPRPRTTEGPAGPHLDA